MSLKFLVAGVLSCASACALADDGRYDYVLKCSGCHMMDGSGAPDFGIPDFRDQVGYFERVPGGRAFLTQVAGVAASGLKDDQVADVTTYIIRTFAGESMPDNFEPYSTDEVSRYRENRPVDVATRRNELYLQLLADGYPLR